MSERTTRKPTGKPPWPLLLIAGAEKAGKSYACAAASASDLVARTFWISVGEDDPDELGALPGARFEIVQHDGTYRDLLAALTWAVQQPAKGKPNLIVLDSATRLWDLLCDQAQHDANGRAAAKAAKYNRKPSSEDAQITMDLWNTAAQRWAHCIDALRQHVGPVILTARLESVTVVENGEPTKDKTWRIKAHKTLPYDVGAIVELRALGDSYLTGVRSLRYKPAKAGEATAYPDFTVEKLWRDLGLDEKDATTPRQHTGIDPEDKPAAEADAARVELRTLCDERGWNVQAVAAQFVDRSGGLPITDANAAEVREFAAWLTSGENFKLVQGQA